MQKKLTFFLIFFKILKGLLRLVFKTKNSSFTDKLVCLFHPMLNSKKFIYSFIGILIIWQRNFKGNTKTTSYKTADAHSVYGIKQKLFQKSEKMTKGSKGGNSIIIIISSSPLRKSRYLFPIFFK